MVYYYGLHCGLLRVPTRSLRAGPSSDSTPYRSRSSAIKLRRVGCAGWLLREGLLIGCSPVLVAGWLLRVTHSWAISGCLTRGLLTAYSRSGFSRSGLLSPLSLPSPPLWCTAVTDTKGVKAAFDRSVTVGVHIDNVNSHSALPPGWLHAVRLAVYIGLYIGLLVQVP